MSESKTIQWTEKDLRALWKRKKMTKPFEKFYDWFVKQGEKCCYCGITQGATHIVTDTEFL